MDGLPYKCCFALKQFSLPLAKNLIYIYMQTYIHTNIHTYTHTYIHSNEASAFGKVVGACASCFIRQSDRPPVPLLDMSLGLKPTVPVPDKLD